MAPETLHVAVAVIVNAQEQVLLSLRPKHVHQGGLWEFPGGKLEAGENVREALVRELDEELGIRVTGARPLIRIPHTYTDRRVLLDVWRIDGYEGEARGREGQQIDWVGVDALAGRAFPAANKPIVQAVCLPDTCLITPDPGSDVETFLRHLEASLERGVRLVQLRAPSLGDEAYAALARKVLPLCHRFGARVLLNAAPQRVVELDADGVQLNAARLEACRQRPLSDTLLVMASCHDPRQLAKAASIGADAALLSPVCATASHPQAAALGWSRFAEWVDGCPLPVYALGGMHLEDVAQAQSCGGQGIAAIRGLWGAQ